MNQNHNEISPHAYQNSYYQKDKKITSVGEDVKKRKPLYIVGRNVNWFSTMENSMEAPQKLKNRMPYDPAIPLLSFI